MSPASSTNPSPTAHVTSPSTRTTNTENKSIELLNNRMIDTGLTLVIGLPAAYVAAGLCMFAGLASTCAASCFKKLLGQRAARPVGSGALSEKDFLRDTKSPSPKKLAWTQVSPPSGTAPPVVTGLPPLPVPPVPSQPPLSASALEVPSNWHNAKSVTSLHSELKKRITAVNTEIAKQETTERKQAQAGRPDYAQNLQALKALKEKYQALCNMCEEFSTLETEVAQDLAFSDFVVDSKSFRGLFSQGLVNQVRENTALPGKDEQAIETSIFYEDQRRAMQNIAHLTQIIQDECISIMREKIDGINAQLRSHQTAAKNEALIQQYSQPDGLVIDFTGSKDRKSDQTAFFAFARSEHAYENIEFLQRGREALQSSSVAQALNILGRPLDQEPPSVLGGVASENPITLESQIKADVFNLSSSEKNTLLNAITGLRQPGAGSEALQNFKIALAKAMHNINATVTSNTLANFRKQGQSTPSGASS